MSDTTLPDEVFAFDLHMRCGGYAYFSTVSKWEGKDKSLGTKLISDPDSVADDGGRE
jgi:hypothetical protein